MNKSLLKGLKKRYGSRAYEVYYSMENDGHPATQKEAIKKSKKSHPEYYQSKIVKKILELRKQ